MTASAPAAMALDEVAAVPDAAVGQNGNVSAGALLERIAGGGAVGDGGDLRDADAQHGAGRADRAGADADQKGGRARFHQFGRGLERDAVADHDGNGRVAAELGEVYGFGMGGIVAGGRHLAGDDEEIRPGFDGDGGDARGVRRNGGEGGKAAAGLDLLRCAARSDRRAPGPCRVSASFR